MASLKRKLTANESSAKKSSHKRQRVEAKTNSSTGNIQNRSERENGKDTKASQPPPQSLRASILAKEQPAFPRGGATNSNPLERKAIKARALRDAGAEQRGSGDLFGSTETFEEALETDDGSLKDISNESKRRRKKTQNKPLQDNSTFSRNTLRIEGLSYKRLAVGSLILGQIISINARDLTIALPNNLVGYVALTAISEQITEKIEKLLQDDEDQQSGESSAEEDDILLSNYFHVGQYVRVAVTSVGEESLALKSHAKKRIELSLHPKLTNAGLTRSNIAVGCTVQAAVASIEDHGVVVDLGIEDNQVRGFVSSKELSESLDLSTIKTGTVMLCLVTEVGSNGRTLKLSASQSRLGSVSKNHYLHIAPTIDAFLPGTAVEILLSEVTSSGLAGKVMGMLDVTADLVHSGAYDSSAAIPRRFKAGDKIKGRLLCTFPLSDSKKLGFSILQGPLKLQDPTSGTAHKTHDIEISSIVSEAKVIHVDPGLGIYLELAPDAKAFAHISRLADDKVDSLSRSTGPFKVGSLHKARILDFNPVDNLFLVSLQPRVLKQPFLRVEDVHVGSVVKGQVEKLLINESGINGILVNLADGVSGLATQIHLSDILLQHPEKKFREGTTVTARVLSTIPEKRQIRLTLKKTLVNSDQKIWKDYADINVGDSSPGTLVKVESRGAVVQFYGSVKGFLPVSEMSEAYIKDATEHFRVGQVVTVNAISVNPEEKRMTVSCRDVSAKSTSIESTLASLEPGSLVNGTVFEKSQDDLLLRLDESDAIARLSVDHVSDGSLKKRQSALSKIRVGQSLKDLLILEVQARRRLVTLCNRSSLVTASQDGRLLRSYGDLKEDQILTGFVSNITSDGIFVNFTAGISALIPKGHVSAEAVDKPNFGVLLLQPITARVSSIDYRGATPRFWLSMRTTDPNQVPAVKNPNGLSASQNSVVDPIDETIKVVDDLTVGKITKARILAVKDTQINVELGKGIQGRIDVSEIFDTWDKIKDRKKPLQGFHPKQILPVRILGAHDSRNHRFLPLTHRSGKTPVYELSAKPSLIKDPAAEVVTLENIRPGSSWIAFVNNVGADHLWVNISPSVRGRIRATDVSDDLSLAADLEANFPLGSALRVLVVSLDLDKQRLDLSAKTSGISKPLTIEDISEGTILPGRVTKVTDRQLVVQLSDSIVGAVDLIDMADDYSQINPVNFHKNDVLRACVVKVDIPNKKIFLSIRPSKVLSSSMTAVDPEVTSIQQIEVNQIYRGFVSNVTDKGLFVMLGHSVTAFVRVSNLSDSYLKEWKNHFQRDQLVKGKIISVDKDAGHVQMSLKESVLRSDYKAPLTFTDMHVGDIVTAKVMKVETFGVFILVDNSENVRGLCHRSEIADQKIADVSKLFNEGDIVKAKVLKLDLGNRRINFGMKASYFAKSGDEADNLDTEGESDSEVSGGAVLQFESDEDENSVSDDVNEADGISGGETDSDDDEDILDPPQGKTTPALAVGGFDWYGISKTSNGISKRTSNASDTEDEKSVAKSRKKRKRADIQIDQTGDLDTNGPQSVDDYERLLLGEPDSSLLWLQYMAFHLELGDVDQARQLGERALKSIGLSQDAEKMNVWIALLNLENAYGTDENVEEMFTRACQYNDPQEIHSRLTSIYIQSGKTEKADELFHRMLKKFTQDPKIWINYATFLFDTASDAERARNLLPRALQTLPQFTHLDLTSKFAQLEFQSSTGLPERGRTIFEGLFNSFPKRTDLFNVLLDLEIKLGDKERVRSVFERIFTGRIKTKQAKFFFKRWLAYEEKEGDERSIENVKARAAEYVKSIGEKER